MTSTQTPSAVEPQGDQHHENVLAILEDFQSISLMTLNNAANAPGTTMKRLRELVDAVEHVNAVIKEEKARHGK